MSAQRTLDVERFVPAPDGDGFLSVTGTRTPGPWRWNVALWLSYTNAPLTARLSDGSTSPMIEHRLGADLLFQLGLWGRFAAVLDLPAVLYQEGFVDLVDGGYGLHPAAIRDPRLAVRARILGEDATEERDRHEGEGLAVQLATTVPIGDEQSFAGEGAARLEAQVLGDFHLLGFGVGASIGWRHRFAEPSVLGMRFRNELFFGLGIQVPVFFVEDVVALLEFDGATDGENPFGAGPTTAVEWLLGARGRLRDVEISFAAGTGIAAGVGAPAVRLIGGISYAPRFRDRDHDRVEDGADGCPTLPEDFDGHLDEDGCPGPDNDGGLIPDLDDRCPDAAAEFGRDLDDDGCNDDGAGDSSTRREPARSQRISRVRAAG